jgi:hypothetical protein
MARTFANNAESTLASGVAVGATSLTVAAGHGVRFPSTGDFSIRLQDASDATIYELVTCTARSTDTLTITATTLAWDAADKVFHVVAKADLDSFAQGNLANYQALSVVDAKGDLIVGTADNTTGRLAVGANGSMPVADSGAASGIRWQTPAEAFVAAQETSTSNAPADLTTAGPSVASTIGASGMALVVVSCWLHNGTAGNDTYMGFAVSGASTVAAISTRALVYTPSTAAYVLGTSYISLITGLTAGSNTFTAKYWTGAGTGTWRNRRITVIPL